MEELLTQTSKKSRHTVLLVGCGTAFAVFVIVFTLASVSHLRYLARVQADDEYFELSPQGIERRMQQKARGARSNRIIDNTATEVARMRGIEDEILHGSAPAEHGLLRNMVDEVMRWFGMNE